MRLYRTVALVFAITFAAVGVAFVAAPAGVVAVFRALASVTSMPGMPDGDAGSGLFRALAGAYMYLVALLAWAMFRHPAEPVWPTLLAHAKLASALLSLALLIGHGPYLVYVVNGVVDGLIGLVALALRRRAAASRAAPAAGVPR